MATIINLPLYNVEDNNVYINGKVITDNMLLKVKKLTNEKYNIDFFIQFGNSVNYNSTNIAVEGAESVLTSLPGEFGPDRKWKICQFCLCRGKIKHYLFPILWLYDVK